MTVLRVTQNAPKILAIIATTATSKPRRPATRTKEALADLGMAVASGRFL